MTTERTILCLLTCLLLSSLSISQAAIRNSTGPKTAVKTINAAPFEDFPANIQLFRLINGHHGEAADSIFRLIRFAGSGYALLPLAILVLIFRRQYLKPFLLSAVAASLVCSVLKHFIPQPRPALLLDNVHLLCQLSKNSFPSADTAVTFAVAIALLPGVRRPMKILLIFYGLIVGYGRMYVGAHFPLDVLTGAFIGVGSAMISRSICSFGTKQVKATISN